MLHFPAHLDTHSDVPKCIMIAGPTGSKRDAYRKAMVQASPGIDWVTWELYAFNDDLFALSGHDTTPESPTYKEAYEKYRELIIKTYIDGIDRAIVRGKSIILEDAFLTQESRNELLQYIHLGYRKTCVFIRPTFVEAKLRTMWDLSEEGVKAQFASMEIPTLHTDEQFEELLLLNGD